MGQVSHSIGCNHQPASTHRLARVPRGQAHQYKCACVFAASGQICVGHIAAAILMIICAAKAHFAEFTSRASAQAVHLVVNPSLTQQAWYRSVAGQFDDMH